MERVRVAFAAALVAGACVAGCGSSAEAPVEKAAPASNASAPGKASADKSPDVVAPVASSSGPRVVCLGDSLTAGYGLPSADEAYPALLERKLRDAGLDFEVINAGVSGDTSAGGLRRLDWSLQGDVRVLLVALGGNDGLRGLAPTELKANLYAIIDKAEARHIKVLLLGMEAPPNFGDRYTRDFRAVYRDVASERHVALIPFFLNGVAGIATLNQADGIHPTAEGQRHIADTIWPQLKVLAASTMTS
jgi:acyl-CoA thioesterase-1